ncbi:TetR/AcrR family transcriptional regulator [Actinoplanes sp. NPDC049265]|uniref:TetR/AcrR family transcriptional regulator n=1 Tax=Actinoplanes sp. NPDC049265 TaxID=3363902 RepID=UPI003724755A
MSERPTRRAEYAAATRRAIVDAARELFATRGYFATRVDDIAARARVAPPTVYAAGGKPALLRALMEMWVSATVIESTYRRVAELTDGTEILRVTAAGTRRVREEWADIMRVVLGTAPHDEAAAEILAAATAAYRKGMVLTADRLAAIGALRDDLTAAEAADVLWFYFGYSSYFTLTDENGWSLDRAERWLLNAAHSALLHP